MNSRGVIGQTLTTIPVFAIVIIVGILFVLLSQGICLLNLCLSYPDDSLSTSFTSLNSATTLELFLNDYIVVDGASSQIRTFLTNLSSIEQSARDAQLRILEKQFIDYYGCNGANSLLVTQYSSGSSNVVYYLIDYPARPLKDQRRTPFQATALDRPGEGASFLKGVYPQNSEGDALGYVTQKLEKDSLSKDRIFITVRGDAQC